MSEQRTITQYPAFVVSYVQKTKRVIDPRPESYHWPESREPKFLYSTSYPRRDIHISRAMPPKSSTGKEKDLAEEDEVLQAVILADSFNKRFKPLTVGKPRVSRIQSRCASSSFADSVGRFARL